MACMAVNRCKYALQFQHSISVIGELMRKLRVVQNERADKMHGKVLKRIFSFTRHATDIFRISNFPNLPRNRWDAIPDTNLSMVDCINERKINFIYKYFVKLVMWQKPNNAIITFCSHSKFGISSSSKHAHNTLIYLYENIREMCGVST